jgi:hypothetical protein
MPRALPTDRQSPSEISRVKAAVRKRDGCCVKCGMTNDQHLRTFGRQLDVHRTEPGSRYEMATAVAVCRPCHGPEPKRARGSPDEANGCRIALTIPARLAEALDLYREWHADDPKFIAVTRPKLSRVIVRLLVAEFRREGILDDKGQVDPDRRRQIKMRTYEALRAELARVNAEEQSPSCPPRPA